MSQPPFGRLLADLRRELRPLGWRQRRRALAEAHDHLSSAIEDAIASGSSRDEAELRAVALFGEPVEIARRLRAAHPRSRARRVVPALAGAVAITGVLALAAGPLADGIAPHRADAASSVGPSQKDCAQAFDRPANARTRDLVPPSAGPVLILATPVPSCVIKFQLADRRVMTAQAPWPPAAPFSLSIRTPGRVASGNAVWRKGSLTAIGLAAGQPILLGPSPTTASCVDAWNDVRPLKAPTAPEPAVVQPLSGGSMVRFGKFTWGAGGTTHTAISGYACSVWVAKAHGASYIVGAWHSDRATTWYRPIALTGLLAGAVPNAKLATDGSLTVQKIPATWHSTPRRKAAPNLRHQLSATGWVAGFKLHGSFAQAVARFGDATDRTATSFGCEVAWPALDLTAVFMYGRHWSPSSPCDNPGQAVSITGGFTWSTAKALNVHDPESQIETSYPGATHSTSKATGITTWYLVPRSGTPSSIALTAESRLGVVTAITVASSSTTYGVTVIGP